MTTQDFATRPISAPENAGAVQASAVSLRHTSSTSNSQPSADGPTLTHGDFVGRYSVLSHLGRGGMGVVYKAYDPQLDRNVAIKLLRRGRSSVEADLRLLREAQTLARLKHPNVVAVYDAGLASHGVFIAMELLEGQTLNAWLDQKTRNVREILSVFRTAGLGLVAAHEAGFIHRDFKPGNVFIGDDGVVKVLDFGLAHAVGGEPALRRSIPSGSGDLGAPPRTDPSGGASQAASLGGEDETREIQLPEEKEAADGGERGAREVLMGTPAYMAPEELEGRTDHRSEQFAFCMSLYVALYDRSPFAGETYEERLEKLDEGVTLDERELERAASGERVPLKIRRTMLRGLATDPDERFPSMDALLRELAEPPRRWPQALAAATLLVGFGAGAVVFDAPQEDPCADSAAALGEVWGPEERSAIETAFELSSNPSIRSNFSRVETTLDSYARDWVAMNEESCRATFVLRQQSEPLFDQRMRCLQRRRNRLRATIDGLAGAEDEDALIRQLIVPYRLPAIADCADVDALGDEQPLPADPDARRRIEALREQIDRADTFHDGAAFAEGIKLASDVVREARELDYPPVLAEGLASLGRLQSQGASAQEAEDTLSEAVMLASELGMDNVEASAWVSLMFAKTRQRSDDGPSLELAARAAVRRARDEKLHGWLLNNLGVFRAENGEVEVALELLREAIEVKAAHLGRGHVDVGLSWFNLANALVDQERYREARDALMNARTIFENTVSDAHPMTYYVLSGMCRLEHAQGDPETAVTMCREVLGHFQSLSASSLWQMRTGFILAQSLWDVGQEAEAREVAERAREHAAGEDPMTFKQITIWLEDPSAPLPALIELDCEGDDCEDTPEDEVGEEVPAEGEGEGVVAASTGSGDGDPAGATGGTDSGG